MRISKSPPPAFAKPQATSPLNRGRKTATIERMGKVHNRFGLREHRKELRRNQTPQEAKLWWHLRSKRFGVKFRRQHSIGSFIVDFFCKERRLIIEVDGEIHVRKENVEYGELRDQFFREFEYKVLRISNSEIDNNIETALTKIKEKL